MSNAPSKHPPAPKPLNLQTVGKTEWVEQVAETQNKLQAT